MEKQQKLQLINEIKQIDRELYLKKSYLAAAEALESSNGVDKGLDTQAWKLVFSQLIEQIGQLSTGGNSVEDIGSERQR